VFWITYYKIFWNEQIVEKELDAFASVIVKDEITLHQAARSKIKELVPAGYVYRVTGE
jgi:hypothetical protein